jgi:hypothetical protein
MAVAAVSLVGVIACGAHVELSSESTSSASEALKCSGILKPCDNGNGVCACVSPKYCVGNGLTLNGPACSGASSSSSSSGSGSGSSGGGSSCQNGAGPCSGQELAAGWADCTIQGTLSCVSSPTCCGQSGGTVTQPTATCPTPNSATGTPTGSNPDTFSFPPDLPAGQAPAMSVGATPGEFAVSNEGDATYSIHLEVPAGRAGMEPSLAIVFNSAAGLGLAGKGFDLTGFTSAVHRCCSTIAQDGFARGVMYDAKDHFCLNAGASFPCRSRPQRPQGPSNTARSPTASSKC